MEESAQFFPFLAIALQAAAFAFVGDAIASIVVRSLKIQQKKVNESTYEGLQIERLREASLVFRLAESLIVDLAKRVENAPYCASVDHYLTIKNMNPPWRAHYYVAKSQVDAALVFLFSAGGLFFYEVVVKKNGSPFTWGMASAFVGFVSAAVVYGITMKGLQAEAAKIKETIKSRLPSIVDLMALTRGAGASFYESIEIAARENASHPAGQVFAKVCRDLKYGASQAQAMNDLAERMQDPDFYEIVFAINKADELGTPIAKTLAELAGQMRLKRQQRGEKLAGEAEVKILFPGVLIMCACMLIICAPFALMGLSGVSGFGVL